MLNNVEIMKTCILLVLFISCIVLAEHEEKELPSTSTADNTRAKRSAVGALHIVTNHAQPIHADVKQESDGPEKVTPPEDTAYTMKSLRKSIPLNPGTPTALDLVRSVSRVITLLILFVSAACEFYPTFYNLFMTIYNFVTHQ